MVRTSSIFMQSLVEIRSYTAAWERKFGNFCFLLFFVRPLVFNIHRKLVASKSNRSRDMEGSQNFKSRSRDLFTTPKFVFRRNFSWSICMPNSKFLASIIPEIWRRSQNSKSKSRDPFTTSFGLIFVFYRRNPSWSIYVPNLKFLASAVREIWPFYV